MDLKYKIVNKLNSLLTDRPFGLFMVLAIPTFAFVVFVFRPDFSWLSFRFGGSSNSEIAGLEDVAETTQSASIFEELLEPIYTKPNTIEVESVNLYANIIPVGVTDEGALETPSAWNDVGWFIRSAKPGQSGNAVFNGHYDNNWGGPAVFWMLRNARVGDIVTVSDAYDRSYDYSITKIFHVDIDDPNRLDILESVEEKSTLTLITCGGFYVPQNGTYNKRLVVHADLVQ